MDGDFGEPLLPASMPCPAQATSAAQIAGDQLGVGFEKQKPSAFKEFHQRAGVGNSAFGKENQPAFGLQVLGDVLDGVGRGNVHRKGAAASHNSAVNPTGFRRRAGSDKAPILLQADADEQPVQPRNVIGNQQHGAGDVQLLLPINAEAKEDAKKKAKESGH